jgi:hypothetical protein
LPPLWVWGAGLAFLLLFVIIWPPRWFARKQPPREIVQRTYERLIQRARWLGLAPLPGQTPQEYVGYMLYALDRRGLLGGSTREDILSVGLLYQEACYSKREISVRGAANVEGAWRRLKGRLFWMMFARKAPRSVQAPAT